MTDDMIWESLIFGYNTKKRGITSNEAKATLKILKEGHLAFMAYTLGTVLFDEGVNIEEEIYEHPEVKEGLIEHLKEQI